MFENGKGVVTAAVPLAALVGRLPVTVLPPGIVPVGPKGPPVEFDRGNGTLEVPALSVVPEEGVGVPPEEPIGEDELPAGKGTDAHEVDNGTELVGGFVVGMPVVPAPDTPVPDDGTLVEFPAGKGGDEENVAGKAEPVSDGAAVGETLDVEIFGNCDVVPGVKTDDAPVPVGPVPGARLALILLLVMGYGVLEPPGTADELVVPVLPEVRRVEEFVG